MNWLCTTKIIGSKRKNVLFLLLRLSIGFSGCMHTHKLTIKQMYGLIGLYPRAISKALYQLREIGWIDFNNGKKLKKGGKFVVHIQECLFNYAEDTYLKKKSNEDVKVQESSNKLQESEVKVQESSNKVQKQHNPPLTKEILKDTSKETFKEEEYNFECFDKNWFSCKTDNELLRKKMLLRFDRYKVEPIFNALHFEQKKKVCLSAARYVQFLQVNPNEVEYVCNASTYILKDKWKKYYRAINDEIRAENKRLEHNAYLREADKNKATPNEIINILKDSKDALKIGSNYTNDTK